jgi:hypothetical protein
LASEQATAKSAAPATDRTATMDRVFMEVSFLALGLAIQAIRDGSSPPPLNDANPDGFVGNALVSAAERYDTRVTA